MTNTRPIIDFGSGKNDATHRRLRSQAETANSRVLPKSSQKVLKTAARGGQVDAYDLLFAATDALQSAATRCGQSMARRAMAEQIRSLISVAERAILKHADAIAVASGDDGPITKLRLDLADAEHDRDEATQTIRVMGATHDRKVAALQSSLADAHAENDRLRNRFTELSNDAEELRREIDIRFADALATKNRFSKALDYATALLSYDLQQRVKGYLDGLGDA